MGNSPIILTFIILIILSKYIDNDAVRVRFTNVVCFSENKSLYLIHNCRLKALQRDKIVFNYNSTLLYQLKDLTLRIQMVKKENGYKPWLYNTTIKACDFLRRQSNPFVKMVYNVFRDYSNINHTCPFEGPIIVKDLYLTPGLIPLPLPTGEYGVLFTANFHNVMEAYVNLFFEFIEDIKTNTNKKG